MDVAAHGSRSRWRVGLPMLLACGCFEPGVYACAGDGSCDAGTCEPTGFCSYPDGDCESGRRYSARAGDGLASACVEPDASGTSSSSSSGDGTTLSPSSSETSSGPPDNTDDAAPVCGDEIVDPGETCDDGNDTPGDGCSPECVASGTVVWERIEGHAFGGSDAALAVAILAPDEVVVAGRRQTASEGYVGVYARHRGEDGETIWSNTYDSPAASDIAVGIVVNGSNDIIVAGNSGTWTDTTSAWLTLVDPDGAEVWSVVPDIVAIGGLAGNGGGAIVAGRGLVTAPDISGAVALAVRETSGEQLWRRGLATASGFDAVVRVADDEGFFAAAIEGDLALVHGGIAGLVEIDRYGHPFGGVDRAQGIAAFGGAEAVALGGFVNTDAGPDWWVRVYDDGMSERWTRSDTELPLPLSDEVEALVFAPDGGVVVLGLVTHEDKDIWLTKFDADGELVWSRTLPDDDNFGDDVGRGLAIAVDGSLVAVGERTTAAGNRDAWVAKLVP